MCMLVLILGLNGRGKQYSQEKSMKDEKETAKLENFSLERVYSSFFESNAPAIKILFSLPQLEKQEMAGAF